MREDDGVESLRDGGWLFLQHFGAHLRGLQIYDEGVGEGVDDAISFSLDQCSYVFRCEAGRRNIWVGGDWNSLPDFVEVFIDLIRMVGQVVV